MKTRSSFAFLRREQSSGVILILCTVFSLLATNLFPGPAYESFWLREYLIAGIHLSPLHVINDGLMTIFFLVAGLEIKRELVHGELSTFKKAILPVLAALGGMLVPALLYVLFNYGTSTALGWGIPMATDIAFALGILALAGKAVPLSLRIFLTALAVIDDIGAIFVIAIFYNNSVDLANLGIAFCIVVLLVMLNKFKVRNLAAYCFLGLSMWYFMLLSGVHPTISGVLTALCVPASRSAGRSPLERLEKGLHRYSAFLIMPLFALANTCITIHADVLTVFAESISLGIIAGLVIGKPAGILLFTWIAVKTNLAKLPSAVSMRKILGVGFLGGIGFTMSIFIALLAFSDPALQSTAKIAILTASFLAGIIGYYLLTRKHKPRSAL